MRRSTSLTVLLSMAVMAVALVMACAAPAVSRQTPLNPSTNGNKAAPQGPGAALKSNQPASAASAKQQQVQAAVQKQVQAPPGPAKPQQVPVVPQKQAGSAGVKQAPPGGKKVDGPLPVDRKAPTKQQAVAEFKIDVDGAAATDLSATVKFFRDRNQRSWAAIRAAGAAQTPASPASSTAATSPKAPASPVSSTAATTSPKTPASPASSTAATTSPKTPAGPASSTAATTPKTPASPASSTSATSPSKQGGALGNTRFAEVEAGVGLLSQASALAIFGANGLSQADLVMLYEHYTATEKGHVDNNPVAHAAHTAAVNANADWRASSPQDMFHNVDLQNHRSDLVDVFKRHVWSGCLDAYLSAGDAHVLRALYTENTGNCAETPTAAAFTYTLPGQNHVYTFGEEHGHGEITRFHGTIPAGGVANGNNLDDTLRSFARALGVGKHNGFETGGDFMSDQAGHILGKQFGGAACPGNLVPQGIVLNAHPESSWKAAEDHVAWLVGNGCSATVDIQFHYPGINYFVPLRPSHGTYTVTAGGVGCQEPANAVNYHFYNPKAQAV